MKKVKNKKSWFKGFIVAGIFVVSVLSLSVEFRRDVNDCIDFSTFTLTSKQAKAQVQEDDGPDGSTNGNKCRCHVSEYNCRDGSSISFRPACDCMHLNEQVCYNN